MELAFRVRIDVEAWFVLWGYRAGYIVGIECSGMHLCVHSRELYLWVGQTQQPSAAPSAPKWLQEF